MELEAEGVQGNLCLSTDAANTSSQRYWFSGEWFDSLQVYWNDLSATVQKWKIETVQK
jgi:hypothetical protein